jgi:hypothetical protein
MFLKLRINYLTLLIALIVVTLLTGISFIMAFAADEGTGIDLHLFEVFRFPTHTLFWDYFSSTSNLYGLGLGINVFLYAILVERILTYLKHVRKSGQHK